MMANLLNYIVWDPDPVLAHLGYLLDGECILKRFTDAQARPVVGRTILHLGTAVSAVDHTGENAALACSEVCHSLIGQIHLHLCLVVLVVGYHLAKLHIHTHAGKRIAGVSARSILHFRQVES